MSLATRLLAFAQAVGADVKAILLNTPAAGGSGATFWRGDKTWAVPNAGADPWTRVKLAADYTNPLATFADITGMTYTPPANTDFIIEAELTLLTTTIANLPRVGVLLPAGMQWATAEIRQGGATDTTQVIQEGGTLTTAANVQVPAGGLPVANSPRHCAVTIKGRSGATPAAIKLQLAAETAGANIVFVKAGSEMRSRVIA